MLWVYGYYKYLYSYRAGIDFRRQIHRRQIMTTKTYFHDYSEGYSANVHLVSVAQNTNFGESYGVRIALPNDVLLTLDQH